MPGSLGGSCLDSAQAFVLAFSPHGTAGQLQSSFVTVIPTGARPLLSGLFWTQQAIGFDTASGTLCGSQCGKQYFEVRRQVGDRQSTGTANNVDVVTSMPTPIGNISRRKF